MNSTTPLSTKTLTVSLSVPKSLQIDEQDAREMLVLALVQAGRLSQSQAARMLAMNRYDLIELMGRVGIPIVQLSAEEQETEQETLKRLQAQRAANAAAPPRRPRPARSSG